MAIMEALARSLNPARGVMGTVEDISNFFDGSSPASPQSWKDEYAAIEAAKQKRYEEEVERFGGGAYGREMASQSQGIEATYDETLPFQWGPLAAQLVKLGYSAAAIQLIKKRLIKDASGKPQKFYHGTAKEFKGDLKPTPPPPAHVAESRYYLENLKSPTLRDRLIQRNLESPKAFLSTSPETAGVYANRMRQGLNYPEHARIYPQYLTKEAQIINTGPELHGIATDPRMLIPPWAIAPPPMPNFLPYLAPPVVRGSR